MAAEISANEVDVREYELESDNKNALGQIEAVLKRERSNSLNDCTPIRLSRRSKRQLNVRTRREVRTLVEAMKANAEKLENLTTGVEFLVQSVQSEQNTDIMARMEGMNRLFVYMFVMLADVTFSTSPRINKSPEDFLNISRYFRNEIITKPDTERFDESLSSVFSWYIKYHSCLEMRDAGFRQSGVYTIRIPNTNTLLQVSCDQETDDGGWLVIQRRQDGSENFLRPWTDYKQGFGDVSGEFWLGNDYLHDLTKTSQELRVDITDFDGNTAYAKYSSFTVGSSSEYYKVTVNGYSGTAGDSMHPDSGARFYTDDIPNHCVNTYKGAWWRKSCLYSNLNGMYFNAATKNDTCISWYAWKNKYWTLKKTEMKLRPNK